MEVISPYGDDVISWGDFYRLAPDAENSAARAVMSSYIHPVSYTHLDVYKRQPLRITDATGHAAFGQALRTAPELRVAAAPEQADFGTGLSRLVGPFGPPAGLVCAPAADPARCLKGAVLAVRLGFRCV